jgi:membrane associated rhomboid family serine protease
VRAGAAAIDPATGEVDVLLPLPRGVPGRRELRHHARAAIGGGQAPTLAAVDLAEREVVRGGYAQPARQAGEGRPVVTYTLMGICIAVWALEEIFIGKYRGGAPVSYADFGSAVNFPPLNGEWWRYFGALFVHASGGAGMGIWHIAGNMMALYFFGRTIEQLYGRLVVAGVFLLCGVFGTVVWTLGYTLGVLGPGTTIGASGGIAGLVGFLLMIGRVQGRNVPVGLASTLRAWVGRNLVFTAVFWFFLNGVVNNEAHVGGLLAGIALGCVLPPLAAVGGRDLRPWERLVLGAVIAAAVVALAIAGAHLITIITAPATPAPPLLPPL